jgi:hypothetical protein
MKVRFTITGESAGGLTPGVFHYKGHKITRNPDWERLGGWRFAFRCSCGWSARTTYCEANNNDLARDHVRDINNLSDYDDNQKGYDLMMIYLGDVSIISDRDLLWRINNVKRHLVPNMDVAIVYESIKAEWRARS